MWRIHTKDFAWAKCIAIKKTSYQALYWITPRFIVVWVFIKPQSWFPEFTRGPLSYHHGYWVRLEIPGWKHQKNWGDSPSTQCAYSLTLAGKNGMCATCPRKYLLSWHPLPLQASEVLCKKKRFNFFWEIHSLPLFCLYSCNTPLRWGSCG